MLIDLCVPTRHSSDSSVDPAEAIRIAHERGLDGIAFADVDTIAAREEIRALRAEAPIAVFFGVRVSTDHGELLCFFRDPDATPSPEELFGPRPDAGWPVRTVLARVRDARGAAIAARPYDRELARPMSDAVFTLEGLAATTGKARGARGCSRNCHYLFRSSSATSPLSPCGWSMSTSTARGSRTWNGCRENGRTRQIPWLGGMYIGAWISQEATYRRPGSQKTVSGSMRDLSPCHPIDSG